ncbi:MAG: hypothetical protein NTW97_05665 [Candidatus Krumholzibacteria bacterium]|nr:hypothetical protein [Candidatus Krumholzibacteria bacterium]
MMRPNALPFATQVDESGKIAIAPRYLETTLALLAMEANRYKRGGLLKGKSTDRLLFATMFYWPFWLLTRSDTKRQIVLDALGVMDSKIDILRSIEVGNVGKQLASLSPARVSATDFGNVLRCFTETPTELDDATTLDLEGFIPSQSLLDDLVDYFNLPTESLAANADTALSTRISRESAEGIIKMIIGLRAHALSDIQVFKNIASILYGTTSAWIDAIERQEILVSEKFGEEKEKIFPDVDDKLKRYQSLLDDEKRTIEMRLSPLISNLQAEVSKWMREEERWKRMGRGHEKARDSARKAKESAEKQLEATLAERDQGMEKAKAKYGESMQKQTDRIQTLDDKRDAQIKEFEAVKKEIADQSSGAEEAINELIEARDDFMNTLDQMDRTLPDGICSRAGFEPNIVYMPFWAGYYESGKGGRFIFLPPSRIKESRNTRDKIRGVFGGMKLPIEARTKDFEQMLFKRLQSRVAADASFRDEIKEKGSSNNCLSKSDVRAMADEGLKSLQEKGWIDGEQAKRTEILFEDYKEQ